MYATVGRRRIWYDLRGNEDGHTLVLLRGLARHTLHWGRLLDRLAERFYLVVLDNRGVGRSDAVPAPYGVTDMADDVAAVLDAAKIARAHVFGTSLGGMIAMRFAIEHGGRLDRLVLGCTTAGGRTAEPPRVATFVKMAAARLRPLREALAVDARHVLGEAWSRAHPEVIDDWHAIAEAYPPSTRAIVLQALAARLHDASRELDRIGAPTLVVSCRQDHVIPPENSRHLAREIRGAELVWLDGDSHEFPLTHLDETVALLEDFLLRPVLRRVGAAAAG